jgi:hypothetical protein
MSFNFNKNVYAGQAAQQQQVAAQQQQVVAQQQATRHAASEDQTSKVEKDHQVNKLDSVVRMLVSAGYFRAGIPTLNPFDKIVGGLCWCIETSGEGVDVDILFTENSTIGQRIKLSEQVVMALRKMQCPAPLQVPINTHTR